MLTAKEASKIMVESQTMRHMVNKVAAQIAERSENGYPDLYLSVPEELQRNLRAYFADLGYQTEVYSSQIPGYWMMAIRWANVNE